MPWTIRKPAPDDKPTGAILATAATHSEARTAASKIVAAHHIFDPSGALVGRRDRFRPNHIASVQERSRVFDELEEFDMEDA